MIFFLLLILVAVLALLQLSILPVNFLFALVVISALKMTPLPALILAFFSGFFLDIFSAQTLGLSSLLFLFVSGTILSFKERFSFSNPLAPFFLTFFLYFLFQLATGKPLGVSEAIFLAILVLIFSLRKKEKLAI